MDKQPHHIKGVTLLCLAIVATGGVIGWLLSRDSETAKVYTVRPIVSGSMANAAPGPHLQIQCHDCGIAYRCDVTTVGEDHLPVCYNCGAINSIEGRRGHAGQVAYAAGDIRRWSKVVFTAPESADDSGLLLKRIVALPGEQLGFVDGDLWINGTRYQKSLREFDLLQIPVFDSRYRPLDSQHSFLSRFAVGMNEQAWLITPTGEFAFDAAENPSHQWLEYIHWNVIAGFVPQVQRGSADAILDYHPYNQYISRPQLNFVDDYVVDLWVTTHTAPVFQFRLLDVDVTVDCEGHTVSVSQGVQYCGQQSIDETTVPLKQPWKIRVGRLDGRVVVQINSQQWAFDFKPILPTGNYVDDRLVRQRPFAIAAAVGNLEIKRILIARDIYWLAPNGRDHSWQLSSELPPDKFFLVGDNQPVSRDSRHWNQGIHRSLIQGVVQ
ncbi:MAG: hypothetical protein HN617_02885 [Planctomycetaceae bacterium]|nr:hypothetical protein [Planctomycetaceae bacterium]MBT4726743.1 hypothetical protein [Planctomycetaceae bacterium]MBT4845797.1 hypothetical protein [Planctomycetaceae bacterium]MBT5123647.1 hypothetical protein [Planctomycetaceae bacterium]MBT5597296.1 hypothetical protein [Planctomycetaceae bacterium]